jgi:hypothetical protein
MSIEIYVFSDRRLSSMAEWQRAVAQEGFDLTFDETAVFAELSGFLPVSMKGKATGFECDHWDPNDIIDSYAEISSLTDGPTPWHFAGARVSTSIRQPGWWPGPMPARPMELSSIRN